MAYGAGLAFALAGCAVQPSRDLVRTDVSCDVICRFLRFLDLEQAPSSPPPSVVPLRAKPNVRPAPRLHLVAHSSAPKPRPNATPVVAPVESVPLRMETLSPAMSPMAARSRPARPPLRGLLDPMPGSPEIAPPWFEPWPRASP